MAPAADPTDVSIESTDKRAFACAVAWPGWARSGKTEDAALDALIAYGDRYRAAVGRAGKGLATPSSIDDLRVVERVPGSASTDFGVPGAILSADAEPLDAAETKRLVSLLRAAWTAFDRAEAEARAWERPLRTGPRGGGRQVDAMVRHVMEAEAAYLAKLGAPYRKVDAKTDTAGELASIRAEMLGLLPALARGEPAPRTPRSGSLWPPRYGIRRSGWHALDHAWEIQDRLESH